MNGDDKLGRNPAWRPAQSYSQSLASISHHFLGDRDTPLQQNKVVEVHRVPVLVAGKPADTLQPGTVIDGLTWELNLPLYRLGPGTRWQAHAARSVADIELKDTRFIVVFARASPAGVRQTYTMLKPLGRSPGVRLGVLFSGDSDAGQIVRYRERLAEGASRFLGLSLIDFGHVAAPGPELSILLAQIAGEIHDSWAKAPDNHA